MRSTNARYLLTYLLLCGIHISVHISDGVSIVFDINFKRRNGWLELTLLLFCIFCHLFYSAIYMCEQIENDEDIELINTVSVYNASDDVSNNVTMIQQQVYWSYS